MGQENSCGKKCSVPIDCCETVEEHALKNHALDFENQGLISENKELRQENAYLRRELANSGRALQMSQKAEQWSREEYKEAERTNQLSKKAHAECDSYLKVLEKTQQELYAEIGMRAGSGSDNQKALRVYQENDEFREEVKRLQADNEELEAIVKQLEKDRGGNLS
eukprot:gnl/MRDRNA2_/MRDRNA2_128417_c0_seq1.p1 gnl/MRDRNA2_/MRDRNA2_128417_c0~~gnl/MRDRNA2_/MRDRNA2_128417_c0_seq1.p1  ORF type:complete len:166 (+),score=38.08 gnl/MRDRNA2_/MRDRNA2_128417_c0_seq1:103-600(+)